MFKDWNCDLCTLEHKTPQFQLSIGTSKYVLTICDTCQIVMLVSHFHETEPEGHEKAIEEVIKFFAYLGIEVAPRREMRKIKRHWHCHFEIKS